MWGSGGGEVHWQQDAQASMGAGAVGGARGGRIAARRAEECREDQALAQRGARSCDDELKLL